ADDDGRCNCIVIPGSDKRFKYLVFASQSSEVVQKGVLRSGRWQIERFAKTNFGGNRFVNELVEAVGSDGFEHLADLGGVRSDVAGLKVLPVLRICIH